MKQKTEGWVEIVAAVVVMFCALTDAGAAASLGIVMLLVLGVWRLNKGK